MTPLCVNQNHYALLDFPDHSNVGDSAIYLGELRVLSQLFQSGPTFVSTAKRHVSDLEKFTGIDTIFLHGGGNFGDLWPAHQQFREGIISRYHGHKIVQLPQTVFFRDREAIRKCSKLINQHPDFTLLVRDRVSYNTARGAFDCAVYMCPDNAIALGPMKKTAMAVRQKLAILRTDQETNLTSEQAPYITKDTPTEDWVEEHNFKPIPGLALDKLMPTLGPIREFFMPTLAAYYEHCATVRLLRGCTQLSSADHIITDRLHAHILSELLGIKHTILNNSYGKISSYLECWGHSPLAEFAGGPLQYSALE